MIKSTPAISFLPYPIAIIPYPILPYPIPFSLPLSHSPFPYPILPIPSHSLIPCIPIPCIPFPMYPYPIPFPYPILPYPTAMTHPKVPVILLPISFHVEFRCKEATTPCDTHAHTYVNVPCSTEQAIVQISHFSIAAPSAGAVTKAAGIRAKKGGGGRF